MVDITSCIRGHHVYCNIWEPHVGEELVCSAQNNNTKDHYAVAVYTLTPNREANTIVGHVPRAISRLCWLFLQKPNAVIQCYVTGVRRHSSDLPQGGLEVPCKLKFSGGNSEELRKVYVLLKDNNSSVCSNVVFVSEE